MDKSVTVCVVGICDAKAMARCLAALDAQVDAPPFDVIAVYDPKLGDVAALSERHAPVRLIAGDLSSDPATMAARCLREATGDIVLLTEDHCRPSNNWVRCLHDAHERDHSAAPAIGGSIEIERGARAASWAFCYVDFFRYAKPLPAGPAQHVSVCNVAYKRAALDAVADQWRDKLHETALHGALFERFGPLAMCPDAEVTMLRRVRFGDAIRERYAFGRWFARKRIEQASAAARIKWLLVSPLLPAVLMYRMARVAMVRPRLRGPFFRSLIAVKILACAWSWGEWVGYLTGKGPRSLAVAPEASRVGA